MAQLDEVKKILRSLLVSAPVKVTVSSLNRDFKSLEGVSIPFRQLGFNSLFHLLHSIPDVLRVNGTSYESEITIVVNDKVAHVSDMVMKQKLPSKGRNARVGRKSIIRGSPEGLSPQNKGSNNSRRHSGNVNNNVVSKHVTKDLTPPNNYRTNVGLLPPFPKPLVSDKVKSPTFSKNICTEVQRTEPNIQDVSVNNKNNGFSPKRFTTSEDSIENSMSSTGQSLNNHGRVPSLLKHMPHKDYKEVTKTDQNSEVQSKFQKLKQNRLKNQSFTSSAESDIKEFNASSINKDTGIKGLLRFETEKEKVPEDIQMKLKNLIKQFPYGIQCTRLLSIYEKKYSKSLDYRKYGFDRLISLCVYLNKIFHCEAEDSDYMIYDKHNIPKKPKKKVEEIEVEKKIVAKTIDLSKIKSVKSKDWEVYTDLIPPDTFELGEVIEYNSLEEYPIGETIHIVISEIYNPSKFWIYKNNEYSNKIINSLQNFYRENKTKYLIPEFLLEVGLYCAVHTLKEFQRALIVDLLPELGGYVKVYLIDYGTVANLPRDAIWFLHKEFSYLPYQAVETKLAGIEPKENLWSDQSILRFKDMICSKQVFAKVVDKSENTLSAHISVIKMPLKTVNDFLVQEGYAKYTTGCELQQSTNEEISSSETNPRRKLVERLRLKNKMRQES